MISFVNDSFLYCDSVNAQFVTKLKIWLHLWQKQFGTVFFLRHGVYIYILYTAISDIKPETKISSRRRSDDISWRFYEGWYQIWWWIIYLSHD